jgi:hypothetical protein
LPLSPPLQLLLKTRHAKFRFPTLTSIFQQKQGKHNSTAALRLRFEEFANRRGETISKAAWLFGAAPTKRAQKREVRCRAKSLRALHQRL